MRNLKLNNRIIFSRRDAFADALGLTQAEREEVYAKGTAMPLFHLRACSKQIE